MTEEFSTLQNLVTSLARVEVRWVLYNIQMVTCDLHRLVFVARNI